MIDIPLDRVITDSIPFPLFVVDEDVRILSFNRAAASMLGANPEVTLNRRGGEALHCIHSTEAIGGCGASEPCKTCIVRASVGLSCRNGSMVHRPQRMQLVGQQGTRDVYVLITTSPLAETHPPLALLMFQDIGVLVSMQGIVPVCMHCKKVREQSDQWKSMDQYLRDNLDLDISHGLCPECQKKYYPEVFGQAPQ